MKVRSLKTLLLTLLLASMGGCGAAQRMYHQYASTHRFVRIPSEGMLPTIKAGDQASVDETYYTKHPVQRFDMVTFRLPSDYIPEGVAGVNEETIYLQRVVGLGGETLEIKGGKVYIDGRELKEPFVTVPLHERYKFGPVTIPEGEFFLLGDNRPNSMDGRYWRRPTLGGQFIIGKATQIIPR